jgi:hypothetical protein
MAHTVRLPLDSIAPTNNVSALPHTGQEKSVEKGAKTDRIDGDRDGMASFRSWLRHLSLRQAAHSYQLFFKFYLIISQNIFQGAMLQTNYTATKSKVGYFDHERWDVYQAALELVVLISDVVEQLPRGKAYLADQLQRAGTSVPLNIAEGAGEHSPSEKARFYDG